MIDSTAHGAEDEHVADDTMNTLTACLAQALADGYTENFTVIGGRLAAQSSRDQLYKPEDVHIRNFYRFEGESNPDDEAILYAIQTTDGTKGTLVDAFGPYANEEVNAFILQVHDMHKQVDHKGTTPG